MRVDSIVDLPVSAMKCNVSYSRPSDYAAVDRGQVRVGEGRDDGI